MHNSRMYDRTMDICIRLMYVILYLIRQKTVHNMSINPMLHVYIQIHIQQMLFFFLQNLKYLFMYVFIHLFSI